MNIKRKFIYRECYLPPRARKEREHYVVDEVEIELKEMNEENFPVCAILHYERGEDKIYRYDGKNMWAKNFGVLTGYDQYDHWRVMKGSAADIEQGWSEDTRIVYCDRDKQIEEAKRGVADRYVIFDGKPWMKTTEPYYSVELSYNSAYSRAVGCDNEPNYELQEPSPYKYSATDYDLMVEDFKKAKEARTKSTDRYYGIYADKDIEVVIPEAFHFGETAEEWMQQNSMKLLESIALCIAKVYTEDGHLTAFGQLMDKVLVREIVRQNDCRPLYLIEPKQAIMDAARAIIGRMAETCLENWYI